MKKLLILLGILALCLFARAEDGATTTQFIKHNGRGLFFNGIERSADWAISLWGFQANGIKAEAQNASLQSELTDWLASAASSEGQSTTAEVTETSLTGFEDGVDDWKLARDWAGGTGLDVSTEMADEGQQSLALQASFSGDGWQEAGTWVQPAAATDWTAYDELSLDVCVPEDASDFIAQLFVKTGPDWTWANTPDTPLAPGQWTTISGDLSAMGDMTAVREYGVKVGTSLTAFEGDILIDNVRLARVSASSVAVSPAPTRTPTTKEVHAQVLGINSVTPLSDTVGNYEKFELVADIDAVFNNPFDPDDIKVDASFTSPSGKVTAVPGFYMCEYSHELDVVSASNNWSWHVRFTPTEVGDWQYQVSASTAKGIVTSDTGRFTATQSDRHGFIRVDPRNPHYFVFDDGTPYFPVGENVGWATGGDPLGSYAKWLDGLATAKANFIRVWMAPWGFSIEWLDTGLGNYARRQQQAFQLDQVVDMLSEHDIYMMLSLINHGQFNESTNPEWDQNPYNAANGGPCEQPACFATNAEALRLWKQRLRYIAARWGYSPNIMTWEWWNEINWTALVDADILAPWIAESASYLKTLDPYNHLITHSGSPQRDVTIWGRDDMDFVQAHLYNMSDLPAAFHDLIPAWLAKYPNKPFLMGEFGSPMQIDTEGILLHQGLWAAPMNGAAGTGMTWWWDSYVDPLNLYYQFAGVAAFFAGEDLASQPWQPSSASFSGDVGARLYGLQSDDHALLWAISRSYDATYLEQAVTRATRDATRRLGTLITSFEDGADGWALVDSWTAGQSAAVSTEKASDEAASMALTASYVGGAWHEAGLSVQPERGADWSAYQGISMEVYVPEDTGSFIAQIYTKTGDAWTWTNSEDVQLSPGDWNIVRVPVSSLGDVSDIHEFGIKIGSSTASYGKTFYVDNVRLLTGENTDAQPEITVEFPVVQGSEVVVPDLTPGMYAVEFWDTTAGTVIDSASLTTQEDGSLHIALPDFNKDVAIKVKPE